VFKKESYEQKGNKTKLYDCCEYERDEICFDCLKKVVPVLWKNKKGIV